MGAAAALLKRALEAAQSDILNNPIKHYKNTNTKFGMDLCTQFIGYCNRKLINVKFRGKLENILVKKIRIIYSDF